MIVVEGPDGSGKSTLVKRLSDALDLPVAPRAVNSNAVYTDQLDYWVERHNKLGFQPMLFDRHQLVSHLMYGPTMRRKLFGNFQDMEWLVDQLQQFWSCKPFVIICLPPIATVKANLAVDEYKVAERDIEVFYWNYHAWAAMNRDSVDRVWDYTVHGPESFTMMAQQIQLRMENNGYSKGT